MTDYIYGKPYLMVECTVYFEPYYHVLKALQSLDENQFPMKEYIIDVKSEVVPPDYLQKDSILTIDEFEVLVLEQQAWPSAATLKLNDTQMVAFQAALTQKFAVIQGPPGTGKTFLGLKIAKTLIQNRRRLNINTPILVVCFTNHALDQFLEGLLDFTNYIVRVGGQSKNERLQNFNLRNHKGSPHFNLNSAIHECRHQLKSNLSDIKTHSSVLEKISAHDSIMNFQLFSDIDNELRDSWFLRVPQSHVVEWLLGSGSRRYHQERATNEKMAEVTNHWCGVMQNIFVIALFLAKRNIFG